MSHSQSTRRQFLQTSSVAAAATALSPYWFSSSRSLAQEAQRSPNERLVIGCIGTGDRWKQDPARVGNYGDIVAVCDVDQAHLAEGKSRSEASNGRAKSTATVQAYEDYRKVLDDKSINVVTIVTPDHWHSKIAIEAMQAGKDVYCEKPLTLTIKEGQQIVKVLEETKRVFQVGTQQRSEFRQIFLKALAIIREGRIGKIQKMTCCIDGVKPSGPLPVVSVPSGLNWEMWLGQAPLAEYVLGTAAQSTNQRYPGSRCHYEFRWWYEYSGGKMTDWGAHHVDIAQWAIEQTGPGQGPLSITPVEVEHPVKLERGMPTLNDQYNVASKFDVKLMFPGDVEMRVVSNSPDGNGILFEGTEGRFHVSRSRMKGAPAEDLATKPLADGALEKLLGRPVPVNHQEDFVNCVKKREKPISDVWSHHRALTSCHLANIAVRLGQEIKWDPKTETITNSDLGRQMQSREQRKGYEINVTV